ncbi:MAG: SET domain-containing protein-lysine N-methyltransferase [Verrucomicrobia bacterium]|nr:MAG: SET domain-containing protein-lysine N-methyltransferase [Verrucomicrobiota bacterium]
MRRFLLLTAHFGKQFLRRERPLRATAITSLCLLNSEILFVRSRKRTPGKRSSLSIEVRESRVHGRGVYATRAIRKGTRIIQYTGKRILWNDVPDDLDDPHTFLFGLDDGIHVIDPAIGGNEARWINHSCQPNCEAIEEADERVFIYALRDLRPGEELFYDYALEMDEPVTEQLKRECECFCGVPECRRTMLSVMN